MAEKFLLQDSQFSPSGGLQIFLVALEKVKVIRFNNVLSLKKLNLIRVSGFYEPCTVSDTSRDTLPALLLAVHL